MAILRRSLNSYTDHLGNLAEQSDLWSVQCDMHERVKLRFDEAGVSIPYPQSEVHLHEVKAA